MTIQILGTGCPSCKQLEKNAREAVHRMGLDATFENITDVDRIVDMGVARTPGLAVDGKVLKFGRVFGSEEIAGFLKAFAR